MALAQPGIDERGFPARVGADQQTGVRLLDAGDRGVEQVAGAAARIEPGPVLAAVEADRAEPAQQLLQREHRFEVAQIAGDRGDALARNAFQPIGDHFERLAPIDLGPGGLGPVAAPAGIGTVEPAAAQPVDRVARLVRDPLLVDRLR